MSRRCQGNTREKLHDSVDGSLLSLMLYVMCPFLGRPCNERGYQNIGHTMVTLDQERKEELFHEVFDEYGDNPNPE